VIGITSDVNGEQCVRIEPNDGVKRNGMLYGTFVVDIKAVKTEE